MQRRNQSLVKRLVWSFLRKHWTTFSPWLFSYKALFWMFDWVLKAPLRYFQIIFYVLRIIKHRKTLKINGMEIWGKWSIDIGTYYYTEYGEKFHLTWDLGTLSELLQVINSDLSHLLIQITKILFGGEIIGDKDFF